MPTDAAHLTEAHDPLDGDKLEDGIGLALSGGGFKAAIYHLGGIVRLNELGLLKQIARVSSVSGGSIPAAQLGLAWKDLTWSGDVATNLIEKVVTPVYAFCRKQNIDVGASLAGLLLPHRSGADGLIGAYKDHLYGKATLQDLPAEGEGPRFVINATNMQLNSLWRFSRPMAADYRIGMIRNPTFSLARIVAASSGFPPMFCPVRLDFGDHVVEPLPGADMLGPPWSDRADLGDGGIYDNMGLETIWRRYRTLFVSNAGNPFEETANPPDDWFNLMRRVVSMIHRQAENNRVRWLMAMATATPPQRKLVYWPLRNTVAAFGVANPVSISDAEVKAAQEEHVRLWSLDKNAARRLYQHGYSLADAALRKYHGAPNTPPAKLPDPPNV